MPVSYTHLDVYKRQAEYSADTVEHLTGLLVGQHCVGKCRDFRIADDGLYFRSLAADAFADGGYVISGLNLVERDTGTRKEARPDTSV